MAKFVDNPVHFGAECERHNGKCAVVKENILFLDDGSEHFAITYLQKKCGHVVIIPDASNRDRAWLYCTSCERMTDVVFRIFQDQLGDPARLPQPASEMTVGELHRRAISMPYAHCREKVQEFRF